MACEKRKRKCRTMELDPLFIQRIIKRFDILTNGQAEIKCLNRELDMKLILEQ